VQSHRYSTRGVRNRGLGQRYERHISTQSELLRHPGHVKYSGVISEAWAIPI